jgi:hypothetical protein
MRIYCGFTTNEASREMRAIIHRYTENARRARDGMRSTWPLASGYCEMTIAAVCDKVMLTLETRLVRGLKV